jgi:hypothetical protein
MGSRWYSQEVSERWKVSREILIHPGRSSFIIKRAGHPGQNNFGRSVEGREIEE